MAASPSPPSATSLRTKIVLIVTAVVAMYAAIDHLIQRFLISPSFARLEREGAKKDIERAVEAVEREQYHLDLACRDWASWDDTYRFVQQPYEGYVQSNLGPEAFRAANLNLLFVCDLSGRVVWGDIRDLATGERLQLQDFPRERLSPNHALLPKYACKAHPRALSADPGDCPECGTALEPGDDTRGIVITELGPLIVSARPILTSAGTGPARGAVILGRLLAGTLIDDLESRTRVDFELWPLESDALPPRERALLDRVTASTDPVLEPASDELLYAYTTLADFRAAPALLVRANVTRDISAQGASSVRYALLSTVAAGLLLLLVLVGVLQRTVLKPIASLTQHAVKIGKSEDPSIKLNLDRSDEIGILSREFDGMMDKLAASRAALVQAARAAGMSDIATGILHNVGNVLNSVNVSAAIVADKVRNSKVAKLARLADVAQQHAQDLGDFIGKDPRGRHFGPFLCEVSKALSADEERVLQEIQGLETGIEHIRELVNSQQSYARRSEVQEPTALARTLDAALNIVLQAEASPLALAVERQFDELPEVRLDRHKLTLILVNLIRNAVQALAESKPEPARLRLAVRRTDAAHVALEVGDNGPGIAAEHLVQVFHHGFTTKKDGHGFGLHASANAATELGGKLTAHSDGPGRGATFRLELALDPAAVSREAVLAA